MELLNTPDAATYLKISRITLEKWRSQGVGPIYVKIGRHVKYRREDLDTYITKHTVNNEDRNKSSKNSKET